MSDDTIFMKYYLNLVLHCYQLSTNGPVNPLLRNVVTENGPYFYLIARSVADRSSCVSFSASVQGIGSYICLGNFESASSSTF